MSRRWPVTLALALSVGLLAGRAQGQSVIVYQANPVFGYGIGLYQWDTFTSAIHDVFPSVTIVTSLDGVPTSYDALIVTPVENGGSLDAGAATYIASFIAQSAHRTLLFGDNESWTQWNQGILALVGGTFAGTGVDDATPVMDHPLTAGISSVYWRLPGVAAGGTPLFSQNTATLWQPSLNVLSLLDVNVIDDVFLENADNAVFTQNVAEWLAANSANDPEEAVVPEPMSLLLLGTGLASLAGARRRARRQTH